MIPVTNHRHIVLRTGAGGADLFEEAVDNRIGWQRVYIGRKVPRILRRVVKRILRSHSKRYYYLKPVPCENE